MPAEQIIFFGDTAHLPYGDKSQEAIRGYVARITKLLLDMECKMVLIACNSASAASYKMLKKEYGDSQLILNVIDPVVDLVAADERVKTIGIIGTKATVRSRVFPKKFNQKMPHADVRCVATPLLAPMIEEGFYNNKISQTIINSYLDNSRLRNLEVLILACTHYPLIQGQIAEYYRSKGNNGIRIVDAMDAMARAAHRALSEQGKLAAPRKEPEHHFYVSDFTTSFQRTTQDFFGTGVKLEQLPIWREE